MTNNYTIVEPSFELFEPCTTENYMQFLEICTRTCYKSEEKTKKGSAEKLLKKVTNDFGHYSITEHANAVIEINDPWISNEMFTEFALNNPLLRMSYRTEDEDELLVSGNIRMWKDFFEKWPGPEKSMCAIGHGIIACLNKQWPFFFPVAYNRSHFLIQLLDSNPVTNTDELTKEELLKHTTMTGRFIGNRAMSHQLVRHRMAAYSQESQRYCNYGKKGFQFIVPPSIEGVERALFVKRAVEEYGFYLEMLEAGLKPEDARDLMPNACKTEVVATFTLDIWKHCIEHRGHNPKAQWQIKKLFLEAERQLNEVLPWSI